MKARHREINIFSMSALDVVFGALGAFTILMLALFPFQGKYEESERARYMVLVMAEWSEPADVDLWVRSPSGSLAGPKPDTVSEPVGFTTSDRTQGLETYSTESIGSGEYEVLYRLHSAASGVPAVTVRGWVIVNLPGSYSVRRLRPAQLTQPGPLVSWAVADIDLAGNPTIQDVRYTGAP